ncbi:MAG: PaaI family thioesterase [Paracoccus sp. (in: a-proteobacteria)]
MTEATDKPGLLKGAQKFITALPYARALGMTIDELGQGVAVVSMPFADHLVGDPRSGVIHGGVVSALMDTCCGAAVLSHPAVGSTTATLDLRIDYMRAARPGQRLRARAECYHLTRSIAFVRAVTTDEDTDNPVASATGAFTIEAPADV